MAVDDWIDRYFDPLVRDLVRHYTLTKQQAQDVAQESIIQGWKNESRIRGAVWPYLKVTAHHLAVNGFRDSQAKKRGGTPVALELVAGTAADKRPRAEEEMLSREQTSIAARRYHQALAQLSPRVRQVFLRRLGGSGFPQIAAELDIKPDAARQRFSDAARKLRELVGDVPAEVDWLDVIGADDDPNV